MFKFLMAMCNNNNNNNINVKNWKTFSRLNVLLSKEALTFFFSTSYDVMWLLLGNLSMSFAQLHCGFSVHFSDWMYSNSAKSDDFIPHIFYWIQSSGPFKNTNLMYPSYYYRCILGHCIFSFCCWFFPCFCTCICCAANCNAFAIWTKN